MTIRILIADDQIIVRQGLRMYLSLDSALKIVGEARNGYEVLRLVKELSPDLILMDMLMPQMNGVEATATLRQDGINTPIIILSHSQNPQLIDAVMQAGANTFLSKGIGNEDLAMVIKEMVRS